MIDMAEKPRAAFATLGCKVAQYETEAIREAFLADGFTEVTEGADIVVVNTCTVTGESDRKCRQTVRRIARNSPNAAILLVGCYAQAHPEEAASLPGVRYVGGTLDKMQTLAVARKLLRGEPVSPIAARPLDGATYEPMAVSSAPRTRAYVKIADGCDCRCTYCAIPAARGPVRSRPADEILEEIRRLADGGTQEIVLTGIETASYGRDLENGYRLTDLLCEVDRLPISRVRLGSLTPEWFRGDTIPRIASLEKLCPHFHLSVQSGSSAVLALMKRRYNAAWAMDACLGLKEAIPGVMLTCDMIVGFPGETEENFAETMAFAEQAHFLSMHVFAYSPREGTPAAAYPNAVSDEEKAARSEALHALAHRMTEENLAAAVKEGRALSVLLETERRGCATGHTPSFLPVTVKAPAGLAGTVVTVLPTEHRDGMIYGVLKK